VTRLISRIAVTIVLIFLFALGIAAYFAVDGEQIAGKWGYIDTKGKIVVPPKFDLAAMYFDGLARVNIGYIEEGHKVHATGKYGYIDKAGQLVIACQFDEARSFSEGLASVKIGDEWGWIDTTGKIVIPPRFGSAGDFSEGFAPVQTDRTKRWAYHKENGTLIESSDFGDKTKKRWMYLENVDEKGIEHWTPSDPPKA